MIVRESTNGRVFDKTSTGEKGGIPLSVGEKMIVRLDGKDLNYKLDDKDVVCIVDDEEHKYVNVKFIFKLV